MKNHQKIQKYSSIALTILMMSYMTCACTSKYYNINENEETNEFIDKCTESKGTISILLQTEQSDSNNEYVCICNGHKCDPGAVCDDHGECQTIYCKGQVVCENDSDNIGNNYDCKNGRIDKETKKKCENGNSCNVFYNDCGECVNGTTICENNEEGIGVLEKCEDGHYVTEECNAVPCNDTNNGCKCSDNTTVCVDKGNIGIIKKCQNGIFIEDHKCGTEDKSISCNEQKSSCGDCMNGDSICKDDNNGVGIKMTCKNGKYEAQDYCKDEENNISSCQDDQCGECINNTTICVEQDKGKGKLRTCISGKYNQGSDCPGDSLEDSKCANKNECKKCIEGTIRCTNDPSSMRGDVSKCQDGLYKSINQCEFESCNVSNDGCGECTNEDIRCIDKNNRGTIQKCQNGRWQTTGQCKATLCDPNGTECKKCQDGKTICEEGVLYICNGGSWNKEKDCEFKSCIDNQCGKCDEGKTNCTDDANIGRLSTCINGKWEITDCPNNASCNGNECGICNPKKAESAPYMICIDSRGPNFAICTRDKIYNGSCNNLGKDAHCITNETHTGTAYANLSHDIICVTTQTNTNPKCINDDDETTAILFNDPEITSIKSNQFYSFSFKSVCPGIVCNNYFTSDQCK